MDFKGAKAQDGARWAWARTGALIVFLLTGILLLASLNSARSQFAPQHTPGPTAQIERI